MSIFLISDLHLDPARPDTTARLLRFLDQHQSEMQALYILGDCFEAWIGDDENSELAIMVQDRLAQLHGTGVALYFQHGNRDFLIGDGFARRTGCQLLPEIHPIELGGVATLLMHGDTLCTDDLAYQQFRAMVRNPAWQTQFLAQPLAARRAFAAQARAQSQQHQAKVSESITDVNEEAVRVMFTSHPSVVRLIHGHTHRPAIHALQVADRSVERIVLPDWYGTGGYIRIDETQLELVEWPA